MRRSDVTLRRASGSDGPAIGAIKVEVACRDGEVVGYGRSEPCPDADAHGAGEVAGLYVRPSEQGRGVGSQMLTWLVGDLAERGFVPVVLWHFAGNEQAAAVYAAVGFRPDGARRPVPGLDVDEVRLRLPTPVG